MKWFLLVPKATPVRCLIFFAFIVPLSAQASQKGCGPSLEKHHPSRPEANQIRQSIINKLVAYAQALENPGWFLSVNAVVNYIVEHVVSDKEFQNDPEGYLQNLKARIEGDLPTTIVVFVVEVLRQLSNQSELQEIASNARTAGLEFADGAGPVVLPWEREDSKEQVFEFLDSPPLNERAYLQMKGVLKENIRISMIGIPYQICGQVAHAPSLDRQQGECSRAKEIDSIADELVRRVLGDIRFQANPELYLQKFVEHERSQFRLDVWISPSAGTKAFLNYLYNEFARPTGLTLDILGPPENVSWDPVHLEDNRLHYYARMARDMGLRIPQEDSPMFP